MNELFDENAAATTQSKYCVIEIVKRVFIRVAWVIYALGKISVFSFGAFVLVRFAFA